MHTAEKYIDGVLSGEIAVCREVQLAYQRHVDDLKRCGEMGWFFNPNYSNRIIKLFSKLKHYKGEFAGRPLILEPWQQSILWVAYGWRKGSPDGPRRFQQLYLEIPKKNGKTTMLAGVGTYHFAFDGESGAEIYTAATKKDQAKLCFSDIKAFIQGNAHLKSEFDLHTNKIFWRRNQSKIEPLSKETNTADGFNPSMAIVDELHRHSDASMVNLLVNSMATRSQPMTWEITTAGDNKQSICYKHREYTRNVNRGKFTDDSWFGLIYTIDDDDDWRNPKVWEKANPNLGTGKSVEYLQKLVRNATNDPTNENDVKRYHFNIWVGSNEKWIAETKYLAIQKNRTDAELMTEGVEVVAGVDLAAVSDFNALVLTFKHHEQEWTHQKFWFWCPKDKIDDRVERLNMDFNIWVKNGFLKEIPGNVVDVDTISDDILAICQKYRVERLAFDRRLALHGTIQTLVNAGVEVVEQRQDIGAMSYPTKQLERMILSGKITHDVNPVMSWMMENVLIYRDANDNVKIHKGKSHEKVDGPVAAVMSLAEQLDQNDSKNYDEYNERGFFD